MHLASSYLSAVSDQRTGQTWTAEQLDAVVARRAAVLAAAGVTGRVALIQCGSPGLVADLLACWRTGVAAAVLNPASTDAELQRLLAFLEPACVIAERGVPAEVWGGTLLNPAGPGVDAEVETDPPAREPSLDDPALILFTSGTTGTPKGVVLSHRALQARVALNRAWIGDAALARALCVLPAHFGHGLIGNILTPLAAGGALHLFCSPSVNELPRLGGLIDDHAISFLSSVPSFWRLALRLSQPPRASTLARVHVGSAPLTARLWDEIVAWTGTRDVVNTYGITETANWIAGASAADGPVADGRVGRVWGGRVCVCDRATGRPLPAGEDGDVRVQTPALFQGYLGQPELTARTLQQGWFDTGDVGRLVDGELYLTGRSKHEINRAGMKIHPEELDALLERHPEVAEACTFGVADPVSGERVAAAVRRVDGARATQADLRAWCAERIRREAVPEAWYLLDAIPKTDRGKLNREQVRRHCIEQSEGQGT